MFGIKKDKTSIHSVYKIGRIIGDGNFAIVRECRNRSVVVYYECQILLLYLIHLLMFVFVSMK